MAWYSNANGHLGVLAQDVAADGSPVGSAATMPGTSDMQVGMLGRTPLAARAGGGFYVAYATGYPTQNRVRVWRVGASNAPIDRQARGQRRPGRARRGARRAPVARLDRHLQRRPAACSRPAPTRGPRASGRPSTPAAPARRRRRTGSTPSAAPGGGVDVLGNFNDGVSSTSAHLPPPRAAGARAGGQPRQAAQGPHDRRCASRCATPAIPSRAPRSRRAAKSGTTDAQGPGRARPARQGRHGDRHARRAT